jgi:hypothetical protein
MCFYVIGCYVDFPDFRVKELEIEQSLYNTWLAVRLALQDQ